eukprot:m.22659 g.22659  ORF g.22659 m.22659 type:complete len:1516 (+) comp8403_c0_seq1:128-4675(+)
MGCQEARRSRHGPRAGSNSHCESCHCRKTLALAVAFMAVLALTAIAASPQFTHWAANNEVIVPFTEFKMERQGSSSLARFLDFNERLWTYRRRATTINDILFANSSFPKPKCKVLPDLLSRMPDYQDCLQIEELDLIAEGALLFSHHGYDVTKLVPSLSEPLTQEQRTRKPLCNPPIDLGLNDFSHLSTMMKPRLIKGYKAEKYLNDIVWRDLTNEDTPPLLYTDGFGARIARAFHVDAGAASFVTSNLAALYWRMQGNAANAIHCLQQALQASLPQDRDIALVQMASVLLRAGEYADANVLVSGALIANDQHLFTRLLKGSILFYLEDRAVAVQAFQDARDLVADQVSRFFLVQSYLEVAVTSMKARAVRNRRDGEIASRKHTMVLPEDLTWEDFDYEAPPDACEHTTCAEHAACSNLDGKCHCDEGWIVQDGKCVPDVACESVECHNNTVCYSGQCYCPLGFQADGAQCVRDPCAGVVCVDNAVCEAETGRCVCVSPYVQYGAECVAKDCSGVLCRRHSFCQQGLCYCRVGYKPMDNTHCVEDVPCAKSRCPANAHCSTEDSHCRCNEGFVADMHTNTCAEQGEPESKTMFLTSVASQSSGFGLTPAQLSEASLQPSTAVGVKPGVQADRLNVDPDTLPFNLPNFITVDICTRAMRMKPVSTDFASTFLPPYKSSAEIRELLNVNAPYDPATAKRPVCALFTPRFSMHTMDHLLSISKRYDTSFNTAYTSETGLRDIANHLLEIEMGIKEFGHRIALVMTEESSSTVFDLATLFWRFNGKAAEALDCVRASLHRASQDEKDIPLINAANVLLRTQSLSDAQEVAFSATSISPGQRTVAYFTLGNVLFVQGNLDQAMIAYQASLKFQPSFDLAARSLQRVMCSKLFPLNSKDTEETQEARIREHMKEAKLLQERLNNMKVLVERHSSQQDTTDLENQLQEAEIRLKAVFLRQQLDESSLLNADRISDYTLLQFALRRNMNVIGNVREAPFSERRRLEDDSSTAGINTVEVPSDPVVPDVKVVNDGEAVQHSTNPASLDARFSLSKKSPSIPSLMMFVNAVLEDNARTEPQAFDDPDWPGESTCAVMLQLNHEDLVELEQLQIQEHCKQEALSALDPMCFVRNIDITVSHEESTLTHLSSTDTAQCKEQGHVEKHNGCDGYDEYDGYDDYEDYEYCDGTSESSAASSMNPTGKETVAHDTKPPSVHNHDPKEEEEDDDYYDDQYADDCGTDGSECVDDGILKKQSTAYNQQPVVRWEPEELKALLAKAKQSLDLIADLDTAPSTLKMLQHERGLNLFSMIDWSTPVPPKKSSPSKLSYKRPYCHKFNPLEAESTFQALSSIAKKDMLRMTKVSSKHLLSLSPVKGIAIKEMGHRIAMTLKKHSDQAEPFILAAHYWATQGNASQAIQCIQHASQRAHKSTQFILHVDLANVLHASKKVVDAITVAQFAISVAPLEPLTHYTMAVILSSLDDKAVPEAQFFFETALRVDPNFSPAYTALLRLACRQRYLSAAARLL